MTASATTQSILAATMVGALAGGLAGCDDPPRVPYVRPLLAAWPDRYEGAAGLHIAGYVTGWVATPATPLRRGSPHLTPVFAYAIRHPAEGVVLFGTGLSRDAAAPRPASGGFVALMATPTSFAGLDLPTQLRAAGVEPAAVKWIIAPTLRFDQAGEIEAFPHARVIVARAEYAHAREGPTGYVRRYFDDVANWRFVDFPLDAPLGTLATHVDLFNDGSCLLLDGAGPTPGTAALLVRLPSGPIVLAGDWAPTEASVRYAARPAGLYDAEQWWDRIWRLKRFRELDARLRVFPGHDLSAIRRDPPPELSFHDVMPPSES